MAEPARLQVAAKREQLLQLVTRLDANQEGLRLTEAGGRMERFLSLLESVKLDDEEQSSPEIKPAV